jgi:dihydrodipicolinate synthase/N-acetylneuraminate lyase
LPELFMKTSAVQPADIARSVFAVPPLAMRPDFSVNQAENRALISHIEAGGVTSLLYGGNANVYNLDISSFQAMLDALEEAAAPESWVIPAIGPDFGKLIDQAKLLRARNFPTALTLPTTTAIHPTGVEVGLRRAADAMGKPLFVYVKGEGYLKPAQLGSLAKDGVICAIKYAIDRKDPSQDAFLSELVQQVDASLIVSGMGERPALTHIQQFKLAGYTSGLVCLIPAVAQAFLKAAQAGDVATAKALTQRFVPLEDIRETYGFIRVLHGLVSLSGIADTGPILPLLADLTTTEVAEIMPLLQALLEKEIA